MATTISLTNYNLLVEDDGSNLVGSVFDKVDILDVILTPVQAAITLLDTATIDPGICEGRLTLTTLTPVTTADVTGATSIKFTPFVGNRIALYDGSATWAKIAFVETSLSLGTLTNALPYDVFGYNNGGTLALELLGWSSATARATALVLQDGVYVKSGATTRRYLGTFVTTSTTTTEDSLVKRYVWNYYNRRPRPLKRLETASTWTYATATWRQANANTANQLMWVTGVDEIPVSVIAVTVAANPSSNILVGGAIGLDSITGPSGAQSVTFFTQVANVPVENVCVLNQFCGIGAHYASWLDYSASGTTTYQGTSVNAGIGGQVWG
jgi:hypothetical protein